MGSNEAPSLLSKCSDLNHMMETFLPKTNCACDVAQSHHVQFETALHLHKGKAYRDAKLTNHLIRAIFGPKPSLPASAAHSFEVPSASDYIV